MVCPVVLNHSQLGSEKDSAWNASNTTRGIAPAENNSKSLNGATATVQCQPVVLQCTPQGPRGRLLQNVPSQRGIGADWATDGTFALPHVSVMDYDKSIRHPPVHDTENTLSPNGTVQHARGIGCAETAESFEFVPPRVLCPGIRSGREANAKVRIHAAGVTLSPAEYFKFNVADDGLQSKRDGREENSVARVAMVPLRNKKHARVKYTVRGKLFCDM